ncbi:MAG: YigZ family protein [Bacilli bacterium]|nr:YigZ family protein [Bacilli bacterium]
MYTIEGEVINKIEITKSLFITYIKHVETVQEAKEYLEMLRIKHPDATHHVSGYIIGKTGENGHYSDDGEPSGTAGMPIFDVLRKNELTNIVIDVVRYFGGIKLGAGGLVRAYSKSASEAIKLKGIVPIIEYTTFEVSFDYSLLKLIERNLSNYEILERKFSDNVTLICKVPSIEFLTLSSIIKNTTSNLAKIKVLQDSLLSNQDE